MLDKTKRFKFYNQFTKNLDLEQDKMDLRELISYYIDLKLEKTGTMLAKNTGYRNLSDADKEVLQSVVTICSQLENDSRFTDVLASFHKFGISKETFLVVLDQLLIGELNWARVMSVLTLSGALSVQCRDIGEENKIDLIEDWANSFAEVKLRPWIDSNNGMEGLRQYTRPQKSSVHWEKKFLAAGACVVVMGLFVATRA